MSNTDAVSVPTAATTSTAATPSSAATASASISSDDLDADDQTLLASPVQWSEDTVKVIHRIVHEESLRVRVGIHYLPHQRAEPKTTSVTPDLVTPQQLDGASASGTNWYSLLSDDGLTIRLHEMWVEIALTDQQVQEVREALNPESTALATLVRHGARYLGMGVDTVINQGMMAYSQSLFTNYVRYRPGQQPLDGGLYGLSLTAPTGGIAPPPPPALYYPYYGLNGTAANPTNLFLSSNTPIVVNPLAAATPTSSPIWGENLLAAVAQAISTLTGLGNPGPFALVLHTVPYADLFAPVGIGSLVVTADCVAPLVKAGIYTTGTLPSNTGGAGGPTIGVYSGYIISLGGQSAEVVVSQHAKTRWLQKDANGNHRFRILERFALTVSDPTATLPFVFTVPA